MTLYDNKTKKYRGSADFQGGAQRGNAGWPRNAPSAIGSDDQDAPRIQVANSVGFDQSMTRCLSAQLRGTRPEQRFLIAPRDHFSNAP